VGWQRKARRERRSPKGKGLSDKGVDGNQTDEEEGIPAQSGYRAQKVERRLPTSQSGALKSVGLHEGGPRSLRHDLTKDGISGERESRGCGKEEQAKLRHVAR